jgi:hypothetical protein
MKFLLSKFHSKNELFPSSSSINIKEGDKKSVNNVGFLLGIRNTVMMHSHAGSNRKPEKTSFQASGILIKFLK